VKQTLTLSQLESKAHCDTCQVEFGPDLARSIEARFTVNPAVRPARRETYCIGGPANMPQIQSQLRLQPGEKRKEEFPIPTGGLRVRCYQAPGILALKGMSVLVEKDGLKVEAGTPGILEVENKLDIEALVVVERVQELAERYGRETIADAIADVTDVTEARFRARLRELIDRLNRYRMAGYESYALQPRFASLDLKVSVCARADAFAGDVEAQILRALGTQRFPDGTRGFFHPDRFTFGNPLERSALEAAIQAAIGVDGVRSIDYRRRGVTAGFVAMPDRVTVGLDEIVRADNDPSRPDAGSIDIDVQGGK
jgi:hypothetical protein